VRHRLILVAVLVVAAVYNAPQQTVSATREAPGPQETVRQFYAWYLHRLNKNDYNPLKNRAVALKFLTPEFLRRIPRLQREMEADVIVCSQEVNPAWEKNFKAELASISGARATVLLALEGNVEGTIKEKMSLRATRAGWRINSVNCGE
jgi:hypothetical protein